MSRPQRITLIALATLAGLAVALTIAAIILVQTSWFGNAVRSRVVSTLEDSTGGSASVGSVSLSPATSELTLTDVVLRGSEPSGAPPFLRAKSIVLHLDRSAMLHGNVDIRSAVLNEPQVNVRVTPSGATNAPHPARGGATRPGSDPIRRLMNAAMDRLAVNGGAVNLQDRKRNLNVRGQNLDANLVYDSGVPQYTGKISMDPVYVQSGNRPPVAVKMNLPLRIWDDSVAVSNGKLITAQSDLNMSGQVRNVAAPSGSFNLNGVIDLREIAKAFGAQIPPALLNLPPVKVNAVARLSNNQVEVTSAKLTLGNSQLDISGALKLSGLTGSVRFDGSLDVAQLGRMLRLPANPAGAVRVAGNAALAGARNYKITARVAGAGLAFDAGPSRITGMKLASMVEAVPNRIAFSNARIAALGGTFDGSGEIAGMKRFRVDGAIQGFSTRYLATAYAAKQFVWDGIVSGPVHAEGELASPIPSRLIAGAQLSIAPGTAGVPLSGRINAAYDGPRDAVNFANSWVALPHTRLDVSGTLGRVLQVKLASSDLTDLQPALALGSTATPASLPVTLANGTAAFNGTVSGPLAIPVVDGQAALTNFVVNGEKFDRLEATAKAAKTGVEVRGARLRQGPMLAEFQGAVGLDHWKPLPNEPVSASGTLRNADIHSLLAAVGRGSTDIKGSLDASGQVSGTIGAPQAAGSLTATAGEVAGEPYNRIQARLNYAPDRIEVTSADIDAPAGALAAAAIYTHAPNQLGIGTLEFHASTGSIVLEKLRTVAQREPGLAGTLRFHADGMGTVDTAASPLPFRLTALQANVAARAVRIGNRPAGDLTLTGATRGQKLTFRFQSDVASSNISGDGTWTLAGDYPIEAAASFTPIHVASALQLIAGPGAGDGLSGTIQGSARIAGPVFQPRDLKGTVELTRVDLNRPGPGPGFAIENAGPVIATLDHLALRIQRADFTGPSTNISLAGGVDLKAPVTLDVRANGAIGLAAVEAFDSSLSASGSVLLDATARGPLTTPAVNGTLQLQHASITSEDWPAGFSNASGTIQFSGRQAVIQNVSGEAGGGKFGIKGVVGYAGKQMNFRVQATADHVRVRYPSQITTIANADLNLVGSSANSILSGNISILEVAVHSHADFGSLLASTSAPERVPTAPTGPLAGMRFDVRIRTAPGVQFRSSLTENLEGIANLQLRGTPLSPGMLGRVNVSQGDIIFFGSKYTITRGIVSFYNSQRIQPILNAALETKVQGVDVTLTLTGPMDQLKLSYSSSPPLPFSDIVSLLATGRLPTSDPVLAASQPQLPEQNWEQMGASALLSQAVASPIAGRLQRLFGITSLQISPQIGGPQNRPQTTVTLYQQVTSNLNITYQQDLQQVNPQAVQLEWAINPTWSAVASRQYDGTFAVDFYYKLRVR
jgi:autotransporter translocation and assembly factor TamB